MMPMMEKLYRNIIIGLSILAISMLCIFNIVSYERVSSLYQEEIFSSAMETKTMFLKDTVDNLILQIEFERDWTENLAQQRVKDANSSLTRLRNTLSAEEFYNYIIEYIEIDKKDNAFDWTLVIWNHENGNVIYDLGDKQEIDTPFSMTTVEQDIQEYNVITYENKSFLFGITKESVEGLAQEKFGDLIHEMKFDYDSYIWVNEIINYEGGDNYAVRRFHPNLVETEGMLLSTNMEDIKGNLPYLEELEGIKEHGELLFSYYFKELNSEEISEKFTYAKLYQDYDWVIGMGIHMHDVETQIELVNEQGDHMINDFAKTTLMIFLGVITFGAIIIAVLLEYYLKHTKIQTEISLQKDTLTGTISRRGGNLYLSDAFDLFESKKVNHIIMLADIDAFKNVNDSYGHAVGDEVLIQTSNAILQEIRSDDKLIRWGGDEFVILFNEMDNETALKVANKIIAAVNAQTIICEKETLHIGISIGVASFREEDATFDEAVHRADEAMYRSKQSGKNKATLI